MIRYNAAAGTSLNLQQIKAAAPSAFATRAHSKMSDRYVFVPTVKMIEPLLEKEFNCTLARQRASSKRDPKFTRHELRLRPVNAKPMVGDTFPEVIIQNSHDGQSKLVLSGGLFRLVCTNGLTVGVQALSLIQRHAGDRKEIFDAAYDVIRRTSELRPLVEQMSKLTLSEKGIAKFANAAAAAAYEGEQVPYDPQLLLASRRPEDSGNTLWQVYNRVQENLIRGGVQFQGERRRVTTRGITHIGRSSELNRQLWDIAESFVKAA